MSIILKGIDLEEITAGNGYARLEIEEDGTVVDDISDIIIGYAIQIPKGHGDIKDEKEIIKRLEEKEKEPLYQHDTDDWWVGIIDAETEVNNAPTILEAEK